MLYILCIFAHMPGFQTHVESRSEQKGAPEESCRQYARKLSTISLRTGQRSQGTEPCAGYTYEWHKDCTSHVSCMIIYD